MRDFQVFLSTLPPAAWLLFTVVLCVAGAYFIFALVRTKMDPRVSALADLAYKTAAEITGLPARGNTPPVGLMDGRWETRGVSVVGNYKWTGAFGKVLWDRILVIKNPSHIWVILVHEMIHAVRRRNGFASSEAAAYASKAQAIEMVTPEVAALLEELR